MNGKTREQSENRGAYIAKEVALPGGKSFSVVIGDLLKEPTDAIVNAANGSLMHGGGIAAQIADAAGDALEEEGRKYIAANGMIPTGEAVITTAGNLPFRGVIHTVGPVAGTGNELNLLTKAIFNALLRAHEQGWNSVSFPAVSSGIFAVPREICAKAYVNGVKSFAEAYPNSPLKIIRLCLREKGPMLEAVLKEIETTSFK